MQYVEPLQRRMREQVLLVLVKPYHRIRVEFVAAELKLEISEVCSCFACGLPGLPGLLGLLGMYIRGGPFQNCNPARVYNPNPNPNPVTPTPTPTPTPTSRLPFTSRSSCFWWT